MVDKNPSTEEPFGILQYHSCGESLYWHGCYDREIRFKKYLHPDTFAHPAKMSLPLADRIFKHLEKLSLIKEGDTVIDFMAGSSRTGIIASLHGCKFVGIELEKTFVEMSEKNRQRVENKIGRKVEWKVVQGDARKLSEILKEGGVGVVSPPFLNIRDNGHGFYDNPHPTRGDIWAKSSGKPYSSNPSNIGNLPDKPLVGVVSPPFLQAQEGGGIAQKGYRGPHIAEMGKNQPDKVGQRCGYMKEVHGASEGQIGNLKDTPLIGVTSPPYANPRKTTQEYDDKYDLHRPLGVAWGRESFRDRYSDNKENIGNQQNSSYLEAMLQVYSEAFRSGISPLCICTKNPTRNGVLRRLDLDTVWLITNCHKSLFCQCDD